MKVCTDACMLGAYTAKKLTGRDVTGILDIGAGTGLLSLMLAQNCDAQIDAVEKNEAAAAQAKENALQSPWSGQITIHNTAIQEFTHSRKYDVIICNPPFYENDLKSENEDKNDAKHDSSLRFSELMAIIKSRLSDTGFASILLPHHRTEYVKKISLESGLSINELLFIKQSPDHPFFRSIVILSTQEAVPVEKTIVIHDQFRNYTADFRLLLQDYYLRD